MTYQETWDAEAEQLDAFVKSASMYGLQAARRVLQEEIDRRGSGCQIRTKMMPESWYLRLDAGIRFPVRVLHAAGLETCQSCEGGVGHAYHEPTIDLVSGDSDAHGFRALSALTDYGIEALELALVWGVQHGLVTERVWRVTLRRVYSERANERPVFVFGYVPDAPRRETEEA